jgi:rhodanese-related sulfurtransferase
VIRQISPAELAAWLADKSRAAPLLLDVREPWEYDKAHIAGSRLVPMGQVQARIAELSKENEVVAICHHGGRSLQIAMVLEKNGFSRVHNLTGGIDAWSRTVDASVPTY